VYITKKYDSIQKKVLNDKTGELESKNFVEEHRIKRIRGGYHMVYGEYEEIMEEVIKSNKDIKLFNWITNSFTYKKEEVNLTFGMCELNVSQPQFSRMIKKLIDLNYIKRINRGIYKLNPFIYVPYKANAEELQREWIEDEDI
jgi:predicted transcriptional regulator